MSRIPINIYEIKKQSGLSSDVYRIIAELCPVLHMKGLFLLNIRDMQKSANDGSFKRELIKRIAKLSSLDLQVSNNDDPEDRIMEDNENIIFRMEENKIYIFYKRTHVFFVGYGEDVRPFLLVLKIENENVPPRKTGEINLISEKTKRGEISLYGEKSDYAYKPRYLKITLSEIALNKIRKIEEGKRIKQRQVNRIHRNKSEFEYDPELIRIKNDKKNWRYSLNLRGLLRYLLGINEKKRTNRNRVRKVLSNPLLLSDPNNLNEDAPFLLNWKTLEKIGFQVIDTLLNLSKELADVLSNYYYYSSGDAYNDIRLKRLVTERYFAGVSSFLGLYEGGLAFRPYKQKKIKLLDRLKIEEFFLFNLDNQKRLLEKELQTVTAQVNFFQVNLHENHKK